MLYLKRFLAKLIDFVFFLSFVMMFFIILDLIIPLDSNFHLIRIFITIIMGFLIMGHMFGFSLTSNTLGRFCLGLELTEKDFTKPKVWSLFRRGSKYVWFVFIPIRLVSKKPEDNLIISQSKITYKSYIAIIVLVIFTYCSFNIEYWLLPNIINRMVLVKQIKTELNDYDLDLKQIKSIDLLNNQLQMDIILMDNSCKRLKIEKDNQRWNLIEKTDINCDSLRFYIKYEVTDRNNYYSTKLGDYE